MQKHLTMGHVNRRNQQWMGCFRPFISLNLFCLSNKDCTLDEKTVDQFRDIASGMLYDFNVVAGALS